MVATQNRIQQKFMTQVGNLLVLKLTRNALHTQGWPRAPAHTRSLAIALQSLF